MTTFPQSPRVLRGAIARVDFPNVIPSVIVFQYNPERVTRTLQAQTAGDGGAHAEVTRLKGAPIETIRLEAEIDATDQLETSDPIARALGIHPQLAALETLIYPSAVLVGANAALAALGIIEVAPPVAPFTLLIWGVKRVLPVKVAEFSVSEEAYDPKLNPIRAKVTLGLRVLSYNDLAPTHPGFWVFLTHHVIKETFAIIATANNVRSAIGGDVRIF
jgi:hypothetical protein